MRFRTDRLPQARSPSIAVVIASVAMLSAGDAPATDICDAADVKLLLEKEKGSDPYVQCAVPDIVEDFAGATNKAIGALKQLQEGSTATTPANGTGTGSGGGTSGANGASTSATGGGATANTTNGPTNNLTIPDFERKAESLRALLDPLASTNWQDQTEAKAARDKSKAGFELLHQLVAPVSVMHQSDFPVNQQLTYCQVIFEWDRAKTWIERLAGCP